MAFSLASAALNIAAALGNTSTTLIDLRNKYKHADITITLLDNQLQTLRAALNQIASWSEAGCSAQLIRDSECAIKSIKFLVKLLDEKLRTTGSKGDAALDFQAKIGFLWNRTTLKDYIDQLNGQILAPSVLLGAYLCTPTEQYALLDASDNRQVIQDAADAASSRMAIGDAASRLERASMLSEGTGAWSSEFVFDCELSRSGPYRKALRPHAKHTRRHERRGAGTTPIQTDRNLEQAVERQPLKMLLLGPSESGKSTVKKSMYIEKASPAERQKWKALFAYNIVLHVNRLIQFMTKEGIGVPVDLHMLGPNLLQQLLRASECDDYVNFVKDREVVEDLQAYWKHPGIQDLIKHRGDEFAHGYNLDRKIANMQHFFDEEYQITDLDVLEARFPTSGVWEASVDHLWHPLRIYDVGGARSERKLWKQTFDDVNVLVFTVSAVGFERTPLPDTEVNHWEEAIALWKSLVNNAWFRRSVCVVVLTFCDLLGEKLRARPTVKERFSDFDGDPRSESDVCDFLEQSLLKVGRPPIHKFVRTGLYNDRSMGEAVTGAIEELYPLWKTAEESRTSSSNRKLRAPTSGTRFRFWK